MDSEFTKSPSLLYLSTANQSLAPRAVNEAIDATRAEYEKNPTQGMHRAWGGLWKAQSRLATLFGAAPTELFFRSSATSVLNTLLLGIPLPAGKEILVGELEYGAVVNICRLRMHRENLKLRVLKMPTSAPALRNATETSLADRVLSQIGPDTGMIVLSHIIGGTNVAFPLKKIAEETRRRNVAFVVDGTHAVGAVPVSFGDLGDVDYYGAGLYKWCMGPKGTAFGWVAPRNQERLEPTQAGWTTFDAFAPLAAFGGGSRFQEKFLMHGCHDFSPFLAVKDMVDFWERQGANRIFARRRELWKYLHARVPWPVLTPDEEPLRGPMIVCRLPTRLQLEGARITDHLHAEHRLQATSVCLHGTWHLILSPHIHNTEAELDRAATILASI